jgi:hypothetical protein
MLNYLLLKFATNDIKSVLHRFKFPLKAFLKRFQLYFEFGYSFIKLEVVRCTVADPATDELVDAAPLAVRVIGFRTKGNDLSHMKTFVRNDCSRNRPRFSFTDQSMSSPPKNLKRHTHNLVNHDYLTRKRIDGERVHGCDRD